MKTHGVFAAALLAAWGWAAPAGAQQSANFRLEGTTLNAGGRPVGGVMAQSVSFQITLDAVGDAVPALDASSPNFGLSCGTTGAYAPAAEVSEVSFGPPLPPDSFKWSPAPTAVLYNLYRGVTGTLPGTFGSCLASNVAATSYADPAVPAAKTGYFYLVTGENRVGEQGIKGYQSNGAPRTSLPACP